MTRDQEWLNDALAAFDLLYFEGELERRKIKVKWADIRADNRSERFVFGTYYRKTVRVNRKLAQDWVPSYVVLYTIYHECLHALVARTHNLTFQLAEARYIHHTKAELWERENIDRLCAQETP